MVAMQVREVPEQVRKALAAEAARRGQSLQVFLLEVLEREAANASTREFLLTHRGPLADGRPVTVDVNAVIRDDRSRDVS